MTDDKPKCGNCQFSLIEGTNIFCRRFPPRPLLTDVLRDTANAIQGVNTWSAFPSVKDWGWCGEHRLTTRLVN